MSYFWNQLDFLEGGRFTTLSYMSLRLFPAAVDENMVLLGQFVQLPEGQHVMLEDDFLASHLPLHRATFGGVDADDVPWLFEIQAVPTEIVETVYGVDADPHDVMRSDMGAALELNAGANVVAEAGWTRSDLLRIYRRYGVQRRSVAGWTTFELLRGLLAELPGVDLSDVVAGYPHCAFPAHEHHCARDVFDDVFAAWTRQELPQ